VMAHGDAREGKWRGNWRMQWVASTLHTTSEHGVSIISTADAHTSAASSRLKWRPRRFKWTRPFRRKTKSGFCACAITFQTQSTTEAACVFTYNFCLKISITENSADITINVHTFSCTVSIILVRFLSKLNYQVFFEKYSTTQFHENPFSGSTVIPCGRTDGQTWRSS
jgi:hypothetical protein